MSYCKYTSPNLNIVSLSRNFIYIYFDGYKINEFTTSNLIEKIFLSFLYNEKNGTYLTLTWKHKLQKQHYSIETSLYTNQSWRLIIMVNDNITYKINNLFIHCIFEGRLQYIKLAVLNNCWSQSCMVTLSLTKLLNHHANRHILSIKKIQHFATMSNISTTLFIRHSLVIRQYT